MDTDIKIGKIYQLLHGILYLFSTDLVSDLLEFLRLLFDRVIIGKHYYAKDTFNLFTSCLFFLLFSLSIDFSL